MTENTEDFKDDELIVIKLPRKKYEILNNMIEREQAYNWFTSALKSSWLWIVGGGILSIILLYDRFHIGVIK
jgi:hypothetical protein